MGNLAEINNDWLQRILREAMAQGLFTGFSRPHQRTVSLEMVIRILESDWAIDWSLDPPEGKSTVP